MKFRIESLEHFALKGSQSDPEKQPCPSAEWDSQRQFWTVEVNNLEQLAAIYAQNKYELVTQFEPSADGEIAGTIQLIDCCPDALFYTLGYTIAPSVAPPTGQSAG
ncbi:MAG: hypothetical protein C0465_25725 [Ralstonia sp.]|jgi:hypothetical protein|uniref:hypothetical protein n=1 Tax=Ralstonia sp. TaxID=54061 RepID=UPI0025795C58|nr:hypothetical protein [Ralstonia sp.]MBA4233976.1 hypothetical protein [Ralstonia sp.]